MRGRVAVVHVFFDIIGGGERLALSLSRALCEAGYSVDIYTATEPERFMDKIRRMFNIMPECARFRYWNPGFEEAIRRLSRGRMVRLRRLMAYSRLFETLKELRESTRDVVIETQCNIPSPVDISYIHFPAIIDYMSDERGGLLRTPYNIAVRFLARRLAGIPGRVLTNSRWTARVISRVHGFYPIVVYPPVDTSDMERLRRRGPEERDKVVVTVSRMTPEKRLWEIPRLAALLRDYMFVIIGSTDKYSEPVVKKIKEEASRHNARDRVMLLLNADRDTLLYWLASARYYLHPPFPEHFGIAVVEGMAAGLIPIVYRDGGAWYDIVSRVAYMLSYRDIAEAARIIAKLDSNPDLAHGLAAKAARVASQFSYERFKTRILEIVRDVEEIKNVSIQ